MDRETLKTGEVAARAGVNVQTLRYYERKGLLDEPDRRASGYRQYAPDAVQLIRFIKRAQELGFTLAQVEDLLQLRSCQETACAEVQRTAEEKIANIEEKIRHLRAMKRALGALVASCSTEGSTRYCPLLEALDGKGSRR
jgi:Hg(II)-responsive transcriptional regulator